MLLYPNNEVICLWNFTISAVVGHQKKVTSKLPPKNVTASDHRCWLSTARGGVDGKRQVLVTNGDIWVACELMDLRLLDLIR